MKQLIIIALIILAGCAAEEISPIGRERAIGDTPYVSLFVSTPNIGAKFILEEQQTQVFAIEEPVRISAKRIHQHRAILTVDGVDERVRKGDVIIRGNTRIEIQGLYEQ